MSLATSLSFSSSIIVIHLLLLLSGHPPAAGAAGLFREYIGAQFNNVKFSDVPINPKVDFHFILSFAIDYAGGSPSDGRFNVFWDSVNLSPSEVLAVKSRHPNVRVAVSLGGDTVGGRPAFFQPSSVDSWVSNAVNSLTSIIRAYHLDGIDIDYEHFSADPSTFGECIGRLIATLKGNKVISFASIAPYDDAQVQSHYTALWNRYGPSLIDYVNFQFYAYDSSTTVPQFISHFNAQSSVYRGAPVLVSLSSEKDAGGLSPSNGFYSACRTLKDRAQLHGIFIWSADDSKASGFQYESQSQSLLA